MARSRLSAHCPLLARNCEQVVEVLSVIATDINIGPSLVQVVLNLGTLNQALKLLREPVSRYSCRYVAHTLYKSNSDSGRHDLQARV
jgi:hypothetical protein